MGSYLMKFIAIHRNRVLPEEIQLRFLERLLRLLTNGYPLLEALEIIKWDKRMVSTAKRIERSLKNGNTMDQAFDEAKFHRTITAYLYFVRTNGDIQASLKKCIDMYQHRLKYKKKFQQIARYPLILLFFFSILLYFIKRSVLPSFVELFQTSYEASATVVLSMMIIEFLGTFVLVLSVMMIVIIFLWQLNKRKLRIDTQIKIYKSIPIYRKFITLQTSYLFATHLSALLKTGMSIKKILHHMSQQKKLPIIAYYATLMTRELSNGFQLDNLLSQLPLLENRLASIFQKNTDVTALERDLGVYADLLTEDLHRKIMKTITMIQPIFFLVLASFIIFIYITLMWPMFQLIKTI